MHSPSRRVFLARLAALTAAGAIPPSIGRALALPAVGRTGTVSYTHLTLPTIYSV